jgi:hypothetical protein
MGDKAMTSTRSFVAVTAKDRDTAKVNAKTDRSSVERLAELEA